MGRLQLFSGSRRRLVTQHAVVLKTLLRTRRIPSPVGGWKFLITGDASRTNDIFL